MDAVRAELLRVVPAALAPEGGPAGPGSGPEGGAAVVLPETAAEAATILDLATTRRWPVRVAGPQGGWPPAGGGEPPLLVVRSDRLATIEDYEPADLTVTVGAGMSLAQLDGVVRARGQWLPLDPPGWMDRSVGALVAEGASGPLRAGFGTVRDHLLGATLVTGDGRILGLGGRVVKNVAGFDLLRLTVGSRGTLGLLASVTLRLHPLPRADRTLLFDLPSIREGGVLGRRLALLPAPIAALEWLSGGIPGITDGSTAAGEGAVLALRLTGGEAEVTSVQRLAVEAAGRSPSRVLKAPESAAFFDRLAQAPRNRAGEYRASLLPALLPELMERALSALPLADGNGGGWFAAHVTVGAVRLQLPEGPAPSGIPELAEWVRLREGSLRGPGAPAEPRQGRVGRLEAGLRSVFDPGGILAGTPGART